MFNSLGMLASIIRWLRAILRTCNVGKEGALALAWCHTPAAIPAVPPTPVSSKQKTRFSQHEWRLVKLTSFRKNFFAPSLNPFYVFFETILLIFWPQRCRCNDSEMQNKQIWSIHSNTKGWLKEIWYLRWAYRMRKSMPPVDNDQTPSIKYGHAACISHAFLS